MSNLKHISLAAALVILAGAFAPKTIAQDAKLVAAPLAPAGAVQKDDQPARESLAVTKDEYDRKIGAFQIEWQRLDLEEGQTKRIRLHAQDMLSLEVLVVDRDRRLIARMRGSPDGQMKFRAPASGRYFVVVRNRSPWEGLYALDIL